MQLKCEDIPTLFFSYLIILNLFILLVKSKTQV